MVVGLKGGCIKEPSRRWKLAYYLTGPIHPSMILLFYLEVPTYLLMSPCKSDSTSYVLTIHPCCVWRGEATSKVEYMNIGIMFKCRRKNETLHSV